ncbi:ADP-ribosylation factor [Hondaea fermentalgiana]|uniref:ADP-ribosylation factor n=1 Tax=Hondaea fermentalgiana TaxID=2315210 RepID=A0A2R5GT92_9STRA|nr:ADP-ribosylation factor [Hondaea fermentalgiana]|eukprot:GBG34086.1 ADP-ribosylation factor [Hondaea fermentalgiana]
MGGSNSKALEGQVAVIGLDGAGKSTIVNALSGREDRKVVPTVGVNQPRIVATAALDLKLFDLGGSESFRKAWVDRLKRSHAVIFVIDTSNVRRMIEVRDEFAAFLNADTLAGKPVLIFANKEDTCAAPVSEIEKMLRLVDETTLGASNWRIIPCIGAKACNADRVDPRLMDGIRWLAAEVLPKWKALDDVVSISLKVLQKRWKSEELANKKSVAEKKRQRRKNEKNGNPQGSKSSATVAPLNAAAKPAPSVVLCQNKLVQGNERVPCSNEATQRSGLTGWRPFCDSCVDSLREEQNMPAQERAPSRLELVAQQQQEVPKPRAQDPQAKPMQQSMQQMQTQQSAPQMQVIPGQQLGSPTSPSSPGAMSVQADNEDPEERKRRKKEKKERKRRKKLRKRYRNASFALGQQVYANFYDKDRWFPGKVKWMHPDGTYQVAYDDGDVEEHVEPYNMLPVNGRIITPGSRVEVSYKGSGRFFTGTISAINEDGLTYQVAYDDGDKETAAQAWWIRLLEKE